MSCDTKLYDQVTSILTSALILFAALSIRDAIVVYVDRHPCLKERGAYTYAGFVVILSVLVIYLLLFPVKKIVCKT